MKCGAESKAEEVALIGDDVKFRQKLASSGRSAFRAVVLASLPHESDRDAGEHLPTSPNLSGGQRGQCI